MNKAIFRKVSLDRLSSPEELDQLITVSKPRGWIALSGFMCILVIGIIWSFVGSIPTQVKGTGMITASEGVANIIHPMSGRVADVSIRPGDYIRKGDVIARIELGELVREINTLNNDIALASSFDINTFDVETVELSANLSSLYDMTLPKNNPQGGLSYVGSSRIELVHQIELTRAMVISELTSRRDKAKEDLEANSFVVSQAEGRILEVNIQKGDILQAGLPAASIIRDDRTVNTLEVVLYVSPQEGKMVKAGMDVHVSPTIVKTEDYGYMLGKVVSVSEYPLTTQSLVQTLGSQELANLFSGAGAPIEVRVNLIPDSSTYSGFAWSTDQGPSIKIDSGNICTGSVVIENRRPIEMIIPAFTRVLN